MAEPISSAASGAAVTSAAIGVTAAIIEAHFDPYALMLSFAGAVIGAGLAKPGKSRLHDSAVFVAVAVGSAQLGRSLGPVLARYVDGIGEPGMLVAFLAAAGFHPAFNAMIQLIPSVLGRLGSQPNAKDQLR